MSERINEIKTKLKYRWVCFFALALAGVLVQFHRSATGVIYEELTRTFDLTATSYGLLSSMYFYPYVVMQLFSGVLADRYGARKTVVFFGALTIIGTFLFASAKNYLMLCIGRALVGAGVSTQMVCMQKVSSRWFLSREMATVSGLNSTIGSLGGLVSQAPLALLLNYMSWRKTFIGLAVFSLIVYLICFFFVKEGPEEMGLPTIPELLGVSYKVENKPKVGTKKSLLNVLRNKNMWPLFVIMPICMGAYTVFSGTWGIPYLQEVFGLDKIEATTLTSYMMIGMFIGSMSAGRISDRLKSRKKVIVLITSIICFEWMMLTFGTFLIRSFLMLSILIFCFGFGSSAVPVCLSTCREMNDPNYVGTAVGFSNMIGMSASAFFPTICGFLKDKYSYLSGIALYRHIFGYIAILTLLSLLLSVFFLKDTGCRYLEPNYVKKKIS